jgi:hypothetical protein
MYMIVFVTMMVALIGAYAQIYAHQAAKGLAQQSGVVDEMMEWHSTAVGQASTLMSNSEWAIRGITGCWLTKLNVVEPGAPILPPCNGYLGNITYVSPTTYNGLSPCTASSATSASQCVTTLPPGYNMDYQFYSVAFQAPNGADYVLTYVPQPLSGSDNFNLGLLCLPGIVTGPPPTTCVGPHIQFELTFNNLNQQLSKTSHVSPYNFGTVLNSGTLTTQTLSQTAPLQLAPLLYPIPVSVPANAIGIITQVFPCTSC